MFQNKDARYNLLIDSIKNSSWYRNLDDEAKAYFIRNLEGLYRIKSFGKSKIPSFYETFTLALFGSKAFLKRTAEEQGKIIHYQLRKNIKDSADRVEDGFEEFLEGLEAKLG